MKFDVLTLFPDMINQACSHSIVARGIQSGIISVNTINPRDFTLDKHKKVDDTPFGGGAGMVLMCQPYFDSFDSIEKNEDTEVIILSPQGEVFNHELSTSLSKKEHIVLICGHYEGFDERIKQYTNAREVSIGDFVLTGGELPAMCIIDSVSRNIDGFLGKIESANYDSFSDGLLEYPHYTKPREYKGYSVPEVLLSGNHAEIAKWRRSMQICVTCKKRPDLLDEFKKNCTNPKDLELLNEVLNNCD
jgi:tRNA (guanine37-N1)-methyltransferase